MNFTDIELNKQHKRKHKRNIKNENEIMQNNEEPQNDNDDITPSSTLDNLIVRDMSNDSSNDYYDKGFINVNNEGNKELGYPSTTSSIGKTRKLPLNRNIKDNIIIDTNTNQQNANNVLTKCAIKSKDTEGMEQFLQTKYGIYSETFNTKNEIENKQQINKKESFEGCDKSNNMIFEQNEPKEMKTEKQEQQKYNIKEQSIKQNAVINMQKEDDDIIEPEPIKHGVSKYKKCFKICYIAIVVGIILTFLLLMLFRKINKFAKEKEQTQEIEKEQTINVDMQFEQKYKGGNINMNTNSTLIGAETQEQPMQQPTQETTQRITKNDNRLRDEHGRFIKRT